MDETYIKVKGQWVYLYRAADKVTMDKSGANKAGIDTINLHLALLFMLGGLLVQLTATKTGVQH